MASCLHQEEKGNVTQGKREEGRETKNSLPHLIKLKHGLSEVEKQLPCS